MKKLIILWAIIVIDCLPLTWNKLEMKRSDGSWIELDTHPNNFGDINQDGYLDILVGNEIEWGNNFNDRIQYETTVIDLSQLEGAFVRSRLVDLNRDGLLDVLIQTEVNPSGNYYENIYVLYNLGNRNFASPQLILSTEPKSEGGFLWQIDDIDGDGNLDLVFWFQLNSVITNIFWGDQNNNFSPDRRTNYYWDFITGYRYKFCDLNGDGRLDIISDESNEGGGKFDIWIQQSDKTFQKVATLSVKGMREVWDFNKDGKCDIIYAWMEGDNHYVGIALGNGDGTFQQAHILFSGQESNYLRSYFSVWKKTDNQKTQLIMTKEVGLNDEHYHMTIDENLNYETQRIFAEDRTPVKIATDFNNDGLIDFISTGAEGWLMHFGLYKLDIEIAPEFWAGGVIQNPWKVGYGPNEQVELKASPSLGYSFSSWSGDVNSTDNPITITITKDTAITANFVASSSGGGGGGGGCFVATACFGSYNHPFVKILRKFRDEILLTNKIGKSFVRWYYSHSPKYAEKIKKSFVLKLLGQIFLLPFVFIAYLSLNKMLILLFVLGIMIFKRRPRRVNVGV